MRKTVTIYTSDLSGEEIQEGKGAVVTIAFNDARKGSIKLDVTDGEAEQWGEKGVRIAKRGRPPKDKTAAAPKPAEPATA